MHGTDLEDSEVSGGDGLLWQDTSSQGKYIPTYSKEIP
jgi:hypothetical protein